MSALRFEKKKAHREIHATLCNFLAFSGNLIVKFASVCL